MDKQQDHAGNAPTGEITSDSATGLPNPQSGPPAGWYLDKNGENRWWDGNGWGEQVKPAEKKAKRFRLSKRAVKVIAIVLGVLVVLGIVAGVLAKQHASSVAAAASASASKAAEASMLAAQDAADASEQAESSQKEYREELVKKLERSITKSSKKEVRRGALTGPIKSTTCTPVDGGSSDDLLESSGVFSCFVVNKDNGDGTESGYTFKGTINWDTQEYTWVYQD